MHPSFHCKLVCFPGKKQTANPYALMVTNLRIDYFARGEEVPLFPKILRNSLMIHSFPNPLLTTLFLSATILLFVWTLLRACIIPRKPALGPHNFMRLTGAFIFIVGLAKQASLFIADRPYSVNEALLNMLIGFAGATLTLL
eukprot:XP_001705989.1 Hypothetical protein GL50803_28433 [Giardia lamblia ATCC 50803]